MSYYVYYRKSNIEGTHDDVAICEAESLDDAVRKFEIYFTHVAEENVREIDLHREGYVPGMMIVSEY